MSNLCSLRLYDIGPARSGKWKTSRARAKVLRVLERTKGPTRSAKKLARRTSG